MITPDHAARQAAVDAHSEASGKALVRAFNNQAWQLARYVDDLLPEVIVAYNEGQDSYGLSTDHVVLEQTYPGISIGLEIGQEVLRLLNEKLADHKIVLKENAWQREPGLMVITLPRGQEITPPPGPRDPHFRSDQLPTWRQRLRDWLDG